MTLVEISLYELNQAQAALIMISTHCRIKVFSDHNQLNMSALKVTINDHKIGINIFSLKYYSWRGWAGSTFYNAHVHIILSVSPNWIFLPWLNTFKVNCGRRFLWCITWFKSNTSFRFSLGLFWLWLSDFHSTLECLLSTGPITPSSTSPCCLARGACLKTNQDSK